MVQPPLSDPPTVVVTRPAHECKTWLDAFRSAGFPALALPLIEITPALEATDAGLQSALSRWSDWRAVMFVSTNAVRHFFKWVRPAQLAEWQASWALGKGPRCWATGAGTLRALRAAGVPESHIDWPGDAAPRFDSEQLWTVVSDQLSMPGNVLIVRGHSALTTNEIAGDGRDWLGQQCVAHGSTPVYLAVYRRGIPSWDAAFENAWRLAFTDPNAVWLITSSQALAHAKALVGADADLLWAHRMVCTHERIAATARAAGCQNAYVCRPIVDELLATLRAI